MLGPAAAASGCELEMGQLTLLTTRRSQEGSLQAADGASWYVADGARRMRVVDDLELVVDPAMRAYYAIRR